MLYFDRIDISEWIDAAIISKSNKCDICHYKYFLNKCFKFQSAIDVRIHKRCL